MSLSPKMISLCVHGHPNWPPMSMSPKITPSPCPQAPKMTHLYVQTIYDRATLKTNLLNCHRIPLSVWQEFLKGSEASKLHSFWYFYVRQLLPEVSYFTILLQEVAGQWTWCPQPRSCHRTAGGTEKWLLAWQKYIKHYLIWTQLLSVRKIGKGSHCTNWK